MGWARRTITVAAAGAVAAGATHLGAHGAATTSVTHPSRADTMAPVRRLPVATNDADTWDPPAIVDHPTQEDIVRSPRDAIAIGERLFRTKFNRLDGAGRPDATGDSKPSLRAHPVTVQFSRISGPEANSCLGCHNDPAAGGSGDFVANVFVGAHFRDPPPRCIDANVTSERNTIGMFGDGAVEMLAREMTVDLRNELEKGLRLAAASQAEVPVNLSAKGVSFGSITARPDGTYDTQALEGVDSDLVVKPFGIKGVAASLREFTINALNQHHGMEAIERFGWKRTGVDDFDADGVQVELTIPQVTALTLFQASLPAPTRRRPRDPADGEHLRRGEELFARAGCATCHVPELPLRADQFSEPNPFNRPGNLVPSDTRFVVRIPVPVGDKRSGVHRRGGHLVVAAYSDFRRHRICDATDPFFCNERVPQDHVATDEFMTPRLWDLATSGPYGHRGDCTTISEAILHHAGDARPARDAFASLKTGDKKALVEFLLSLGADPDYYRRTR